MPNKTKTFGVAAVLALLAATPLLAQTKPSQTLSENERSECSKIQKQFQ